MSKIVFVIYVTGPGIRNRQTITGFQEACARLFNDTDYEIRIVDIVKAPAQAEQKKILAAPTIIRESPLPEKRTIGDTSNADRALRAIHFLTDDLNHTNHAKD